MRFFHDIPLLPDDAIFSLPLLFAADPRTQKVNLGIGVYQDEEGKNIVLPCVRKAEMLLSNMQLGKNYLPIDGNADFIQETIKLIFGNTSLANAEKRIFCVETVGGAGALRLGAEFLHTLIGRNIYISDPTWINHKNIFSRSGMEIHTYPYYDDKKHILNFPALAGFIKNMPAGSIILLHGCGHNPTGIDPTPEQWRELSALIKARGIIPFFDLAYQGFGMGFEEDAYAVRYFTEQGHELLVAYSFSKNMGLYGERVGALAIVSASSDNSLHVASQVRQMIRGVYSTPPLHGGRIAALILKSEELKVDWLADVSRIRARLETERQDLAKHLAASPKRIDYHFLTQQRGMFSFCGLTPENVQQLIEKYAIYLPADGRINIAGLNKNNIEYVSQSILETTSA